VAESNINNSINTNLLMTPGYNFINSNTISDERKSRICCFFKNGWTPNLNDMGTTDEIIIMEKLNRTIIGIYRPFKVYQGETASQNFVRLLNCIQMYMDKNRTIKITIIGDFNVDYLKMGDRSYQRYQLANTLLDFQIQNGLIQKVKEITRHRIVTRNNIATLQTSLLDHVYTNDLEVETIKIIPTISSDHDLVKVEFDEKNT